MYNGNYLNKLVKHSTDMLKLPIIVHAINIHLPNKVVYPYPLITPNNLSSQQEHQYPLIELRRVKQHSVKP